MKTKKTDAKPTHTPGPWVFGVFHGQMVEIVDPVSGHRIADVINWDPATMKNEEQYYEGHPHYHGGRNECPNARLIAAAPELLAALKDLMGKYTFHENDEDMVKAAIAKAEAR